MKAPMKLGAAVLAAAAILSPGARAVTAPTASTATTATAVDAPRASGLELIKSFNTPGGTDLEFFSRTLDSYEAADGTTVTPPAPVERHFAMVGNQSSGARIYDVTEPEQTYEVAKMSNCTIGQGDIQVRKDGMVAAIAAQTGGTCRVGTKTFSSGSVLVDLSNVYAPRAVGTAPEGAGSHNHTIHPGGKYLYISTSATTPNGGSGNARIPIFDISDPANPKKVKDWVTPGNGPHDIRFSEDGKRAYMAGISVYRVVNTEDPANPVLISTIVPPGGSIGHDTLITPDKRFLFLGDEAGGGATFPCPGGAIYAYDLLDERAPVLIGIAEAGGGPVTNRMVDEPAAGGVNGGCTSHVMDLNPDKKSLTLGWYTLGTRIFDFSFFYNSDGTPKTAGAIGAAWGKYGAGLVETAFIHPEGANTWSAKQYHKVPGYVFSDDIKLGLYISKIKK